MNRKCLLMFLACILLFGCSEKKSNQETINGSQFIKELRKEAICLTDIDSYGYKILQEYPIKEYGDGNSVLYVVDGSCSVCIAKLLKIIELLSTFHCDSRINVIVEKRFEASVEFYIEKYFKGQNYLITLVEDGLISSNDYNGIIMAIHKGKIVESAIFVDMKI